METERFEALIDAILAIIITIIVMEIPFPETSTPTALLQLYPEFISYTVSFLICFFIWYYHHNLFNITNKINSTITWTSAIMIIIVGLLPHVTTMVAHNYYTYLAQAMFGLIFYLANINAFIVEELLTRADKANIALKIAVKNREKITVIITVIYIITNIIGYLYYPPTIIIGSLLIMLTTFIPREMLNKIKLPL